LARLADHQRIARENGDKLLDNPTLALTAITRQQSTFTHQDLARFINRHTVDSEQFQQVYDKVKGSEQLIFLGLDERGLERFTTQELLAIESRMLENSSLLSARAAHQVEGFQQKVALSSKALTEEQRFAFDHLVAPSDLSCVVGYAGTGKSYLLGITREAWESQGYQVLGATLSGIAAENLEASSGIESRTLASRFYYWEKGEQLLTSKDILVIDEAGMIGSRQMAKVLNYAKEAHAKVVLVGDPEQLQAIEAGAAFRAITERINYVELTDIRRQREAWQKEATKELATGKTIDALLRYEKHQNLHGFDTQEAAKQSLVQLWNDARISSPDQTQIMLAYTRQDAKELNEMARDFRRQNNELGEAKAFMTERGERHFAVNDRLYFLKNDRQLGVMNGTLGTVENINNKQITVRLDQDEREPNKAARLVTIDTKNYNYLEHGYAATIHKGQGVTVDRSYVLASKYFDRHATYVSCTRHRESADIFYSRENFANEKALAQTLSRERSKDMTLDYQREITPTRSLEKNVSSALDERSKATERIKDPLAELKAFKEAYENKHPHQAQAFKESLSPYAEKQALETEKQIQLLEKAVEKSRMPRTAKEELERYAAKVAKQPDVMAYLKQHHKDLSDKIQGLAKSREISLERDRGGRSL
jgi:Ti-type conjugative transfer relaxase TraA